MLPEGRLAPEGYVIRAENLVHLAAFLGLRSDPAKVIALSADGISLLARHPLRGERAMTLELANRSRTFSRLLPLQVLRVQPADSSYLVDGQFTNPIPQNDLDALLA
jgi:hypothetical protein